MATRDRKRSVRVQEGQFDYVFSGNRPPHRFDLFGLKQYDANEGSLGQGMGNIYNMQPGDTVINSSETALINVMSGNLEKSNDPDFAKAKCVLKEINLPLPTSENGVYWGSWNDPDLNGVTVEWDGVAGTDINFTFITQAYKGASKKCDRRFAEFVVTLYHEVKGHNIDEASHDTQEETDQYGKKYEDPIRDALLVKKLLNACCGKCKVGL